jgi:CDP-6-deoxy-D-xylo-4-hexulose-3-dehydrase
MKLNYGKFGFEIKEEYKKNIDEIHKNIKEICINNNKNTFNIKSPIIRLHEPTYTHEEINAAVDVLLSTKVTMGENVRKFEDNFCQSTKTTYSVTCNSGSSANLLAIASLASQNNCKLKPGDEVIVPAVSWSTTIWPLIQYGLIPVIVDVGVETFNIDVEKIKSAITERTKAIMLVHVYGNPCDIESIQSICSESNLILIEDCCEALGATYKNRSVGTFGAIGTFSFYFSHHISTLEGGICITNNEIINDQMIINRAHGWVRDLKDSSRYTSKYADIDPRFLFVDVGYNLRMTELQGAMGIIQLTKLSKFVEKRKEVTILMEESVDKNSRLKHQQRNLEGESSCFGFAVMTENKQSKIKFEEFMTKKGIESRPIICGNIARQPALKKYAHRVVGTLKNADKIMDCGISIGNHQNLTGDEIQYLQQALLEFK